MPREYLTDGHLKKQKKGCWKPTFTFTFSYLKIVPEELHPAEI